MEKRLSNILKKIAIQVDLSNLQEITPEERDAGIKRLVNSLKEINFLFYDTMARMIIAGTNEMIRTGDVKIDAALQTKIADNVYDAEKLIKDSSALPKAILDMLVLWRELMLVIQGVVKQEQIPIAEERTIGNIGRVNKDWLIRVFDLDIDKYEEPSLLKELTGV